MQDARHKNKTPKKIKIYGNMRSSLSLVLVSTCLASGCASIVGGTTQVVSVETHQSQSPVTGARCEMVNSKGTFHVTTPGTATVGRAYGDLTVRCDKNGMETGQATVVSATKALAFGNILFGGAIGVAVDASSGAAYDYPELIRVGMGETVVINARDVAPATLIAANAEKPATAVPGSGASGGLPGTDAKEPVASAAPRVAVQAEARSAQPVAMDDLRHLLPPR
ncbi:hypothetical protein [Cupriavidus alkaliphilus]|uniref:hypothetical protein n=1 Tax=Cupriavidus alkaliphilus TaxID=942866 RepID=UPI0010576AD8|nr:hypothetical protein [Cupriavidus alkaliphilus]